MNDFKQCSEIQSYVGYIVTTQRWNREKQEYLVYKRVLFSNENDAMECLNILDEFKRLVRYDLLIHNTMRKDILFYDSNTIHTLSGFTITYDDYISTRNQIHKIQLHPKKSWIYMDEYVKLFGYKPRRPRSFVQFLVCCCSCACCCFGCCTYTIPDDQSLPIT